MLDRLKLRLGIKDESEDALLDDILISSKSEILNRRFPFGYSESQDVPPQYKELQLQAAIEIYNKIGAEGQTSHSENSVNRTYENSGVSEQILSQIVPIAKV